MGGALAYAEPVVSAELSKTNYSVGDLVTLTVNLSGNPGLHGLYFDLGYDAGIFSFIDLSESNLPKSVNAAKPGASHVLYAATDPVTAATLGYHVVVSFSLNDALAMTSANGSLVEFHFRVIGSGGVGAQPRFTFKPAG